ncbi:hypothetical protein [Streptomyces chartreusis]|uniref:Uncharacterized protein n=1 Tax=Streptomyces chartreusis TaxID=1969 RepID=A0A7I0NSE7_STRCX|nr:hypothetical protein [Streptomyces chartreusis]QKZ15990.1 hypothetical protein HUT05_00355 [Streptomyces chartreusis]
MTGATAVHGLVRLDRFVNSMAFAGIYQRWISLRADRLRATSPSGNRHSVLSHEELGKARAHMMRMGHMAGAAVLAAVSVNFLVIPQAAQAASAYEQVIVCNESGSPLTDVTVTGTNQNGATVTFGSDGRFDLAGSGDARCGVTRGYWFKTGTNLNVAYTQGMARSSRSVHFYGGDSPVFVP